MSSIDPLSRQGLLLLLLLAPILLFSLMGHELAHGLMANWLGDPTAKRMGRLSINPIRHLDPMGTAMFFITYLLGWFIFGWAKPVPVSPYHFKNRQRGMALVGLAGPLTNFAFAIAFASILNAIPEPGTFVARLLLLLFQVNVVLGVFNLIPVPPLDGSRVIGAFLPRGAYEKWVELDRYGMIFALLVLFIVIYSGVLGWALNGMADVFIPNHPISWG